MPATEHIHLPLYTDEETPDLSTTGHYNHAMEILDANVGELEAKDAELAEDIATETEQRKAADAALEKAVSTKAEKAYVDGKVADEATTRANADAVLEGKVTAEATARDATDKALDAKVAAEVKARTDADAALDAKIAAETKARDTADKALDAKVAAEATARENADNAINAAIGGKADSADVTALGKRIDNAEVEISANSADLTGIKGLTYGTGGQVFLENENGEYSSPALEEIQHEIEDGSITWLDADNLPENAFEVLSKAWPRCGVYKTTVPTHPAFKNDTVLMFSSTRPRFSAVNTPIFAYIMIYSDNTVSVGNYALNPNILQNVSGTIKDSEWEKIKVYPSAMIFSADKRFLRTSRIDDTAVYADNVYAVESGTPDENGENVMAYIDHIVLNTKNKTVDKGTLRLVPHRYFDFAHLKDKPFSTIGSGLKVENDALTVDTSTLPGSGGLTVIEYKFSQTAAIYKQIAASWPNCVIHESYYYLYPRQISSTAPYSYLFSTLENFNEVAKINYRQFFETYSSAGVGTVIKTTTRWGDME